MGTVLKDIGMDHIVQMSNDLLLLEASETHE